MGREDDLEPYRRYRSDRFCRVSGNWYFLTREGTMEGPFTYKCDARNRLEDYIKIMRSGMLPVESGLAILPV